MEKLLLTATDKVWEWQFNALQRQNNGSTLFI